MRLFKIRLWKKMKENAQVHRQGCHGGDGGVGECCHLRSQLQQTLSHLADYHIQCGTGSIYSCHTSQNTILTAAQVVYLDSNSSHSNNKRRHTSQITTFTAAQVVYRDRNSSHSCYTSQITTFTAAQVVYINSKSSHSCHTSQISTFTAA
jgi:hypothetical protein